MKMARPARPSDRRWFRPPGRFYLAHILMAALLLLVGASVPAGYFFLLVPGMLAFLLLGVWWAVRLIAALVMDIRRCRRLLHRAAWRRRWLLPPLVAAATVALLALNIPTHMIFRLSRPAMERRARAFALDPTIANARWIGLYPVENVRMDGSRFAFQVRGSGFLDSEGFLYSPQQPPAPKSHWKFTPMGGGWYAYTERF